MSNEIRILEANLDSRVSELQSTAHVKTFELDRLHLVHDETRKNLERAQVDNEMKTRKLELVTADFGELQRKSSLLENDLQSEVNELKNKLKVYENLEKEMDDIVMQAAEQEEGADCRVDEAERVLFSYGYGANVPVTAKRRMKQSVQLARRILNLEKINSSHCKEKEALKEEIREMRKKLDAKEKLLLEANQPMSYMLEGMKRRDDDIGRLQEEAEKMEKKVIKLEKENGHLIDAKRQLSLDLDKLLSHREELEIIKGVLMKMSKGAELTAINRKLGRSLPQVNSRGEINEGKLNDPSPVVFTRDEPPPLNKHKYNKFKTIHLS